MAGGGWWACGWGRGAAQDGSAGISTGHGGSRMAAGWQQPCVRTSSRIFSCPPSMRCSTLSITLQHVAATAAGRSSQLGLGPGGVHPTAHVLLDRPASIAAQTSRM